MVVFLNLSGCLEGQKGIIQNRIITFSSIHGGFSNPMVVEGLRNCIDF